MIARHLARLSLDPERALGVLVQPVEPVARQAGAVRGVKDRKAVAVEADQPVEGRQPQVAVAGLDEVVDLVDGQPVLNRPPLDEVVEGCA